MFPDEVRLLLANVTEEQPIVGSDHRLLEGQTERLEPTEQLGNMIRNVARSIAKRDLGH
jgi:hypothetical protein